MKLRTTPSNPRFEGVCCFCRLANEGTPADTGGAGLGTPRNRLGSCSGGSRRGSVPHLAAKTTQYREKGERLDGWMSVLEQIAG